MVSKHASKHLSDGVYIFHIDGASWEAAEIFNGRVVGRNYEWQQATHDAANDKWAKFNHNTGSQLSLDEENLACKVVMGYPVHEGIYVTKI